MSMESITSGFKDNRLECCIKNGNSKNNITGSDENKILEVSGAGGPPPCALLKPDLNLSAHPVPIIRLLLTASPSPPVPPIKSLISESGWIIHPLRSRRITVLHHYYGVARPCAPHRYSHSYESSTLISPLASGRQVPTLHMKA